MNIITKTIRIEGMTCVHCENLIEQTLQNTKGIINAKVSYVKGTAVVSYNQDLISLNRIEEMIRQLDYNVINEIQEDNRLNIYNQENQSTAGAKEQFQAEPNYKEQKYKEKIHNEQIQKDKKHIDFTNVVGVIIIILATYMMVSHFGLSKIFQSFPVVNEKMGYGMLFLIGLLTSVHCVAMCGGICLSQCVPNNSSKEETKNSFRPSLLYNLGRVLSYTVVGGIVGAIGSVISFSGTMKGIVQIVAGVFMVIMGLNMLNIFPWLRRFNPRMPKVFAKKIYAGKQNNGPFYIGLLNGLMPCGPLQAMQLYALSTGSLIAGAFSMFLFAVGTVPLMFTFGAISSLLNKKFTNTMMKVSAGFVILLGIFMFSYGTSLSGISIPSAYAITNSTKSSTKNSKNTAIVKDGVQIITTTLSSGQYEPIIVQKNIPVKWTIIAEDSNLNGCNNSIIIPKYNLQKNLKAGKNVIKFTPKESGVIPYSCWMGMIRSKITVVDDVKNIKKSIKKESNNTTPAVGQMGGCCSASSTGYSN